MREDSDNAKGQLLRAEHLFYVTLKYTRTADVIRNAIKRLISALDYTVEDMLEAKKTKNIPTIPLMRVDLLKKIYPKDKKVNELIEFYYLLRRIDKSRYDVKEEFRKNVALIAEGEVVNIERLKEFLHKTKEFVELYSKK
ncbi:MAG: hypothetical protein QW404_01200 [Candidatus Nanoarchaeia archaeon]